MRKYPTAGGRGGFGGIIPDVVRIEPTPHELTTRCSPIELHIMMHRPNPPKADSVPRPRPPDRRSGGRGGYILGMMMRLELNQQPIGLQPFALPLSYTSSKYPPRPPDRRSGSHPPNPPGSRIRGDPPRPSAVGHPPIPPTAAGYIPANSLPKSPLTVSSLN